MYPEDNSNELTLADADELYYNYRSAYEGLKEEIYRLNVELERRHASIAAYENARADYAACEMDSYGDINPAEKRLKTAAGMLFSMPRDRSFNS